MKSEEYLQKLRHLQWLKEIEKDYQGHAEILRKNNFDITIQSVNYTIKGGLYHLNLNPHRSMEPRYIYGGLSDALDRIRKEIEDLQKELKTVIVQL